MIRGISKIKHDIEGNMSKSNRVWEDLPKSYSSSASSFTGTSTLVTRPLVEQTVPNTDARGNQLDEDRR